MQESSSIRFCTSQDVGALLEFIGTHWRKDHIFTRDRELFDYQHKIDDTNYSFVCAWQGDEIVACLGFTAMEQYMPAEKRHAPKGRHPFYGKGLWLCLWKSREDVAAGMGFYLFRFLEEQLEPEWSSAIGYSPFSEKVFKMLRWDRTLMQHFIRMNPDITSETLTLAKIAEPNILAKPEATHELKQVNWSELQGVETGGSVPQKKTDYLSGRYARHPGFKYDLLALVHEGKPVAYLVVRLVEVPEGKCVRIIDFYGDISQSISISDPNIFFSLYPGIQYVDLMCNGLNPAILDGLGLREKTESEMVPEYFAPFKPENIVVKAAVSRPIESFHYCKGDADQDRPN
jgi:hypothetical protein